MIWAEALASCGSSIAPFSQPEAEIRPTSSAGGWDEKVCNTHLHWLACSPHLLRNKPLLSHATDVGLLVTVDEPHKSRLIEGNSFYFKFFSWWLPYLWWSFLLHFEINLCFSLPLNMDLNIYLSLSWFSPCPTMLGLCKNLSSRLLWAHSCFWFPLSSCLPVYFPAYSLIYVSSC